MSKSEKVGEQHLQNELSDRESQKPRIENLILATCEAVAEKCEELEVLEEQLQLQEKDLDQEDVLEADSEAEVRLRFIWFGKVNPCAAS